MLIGTTTTTIGIVRGFKLFHLAMGVESDLLGLRGDQFHARCPLAAGMHLGDPRLYASYPGWSSSATRLDVSRHTTHWHDTLRRVGYGLLLRSLGLTELAGLIGEES